MDLLILRHGEAGQRSNSAADFKRTLTIKGKKEIEEITTGLKTLGINFDYILSSPLPRARQTAKIFLKTLKSKIKIEELDELKPEGNKLELYNKLSKLKRDSIILVVGHEPYLREMISDMISSSDCRIDLKKAGLARIRVLTILPKIKGELRWLLTPKHLKKMT